ncbi:uncharacterized protein LOC111020939 isoform X2 [Momordica charantia]|uniref:Uncharacterized protein LOC111020939 isoform X2 n=1 Tax=Momordica charantia TaxID=3673 RepID=A0A6J1DGU1_MOMCH|nr:uncharacterized protein LOC111020939 isoform X2 [Momordica charantia]
MEQTPPYPRRLNVNLKNLPPINPRTGNGNHHFSIPAKFEKSRYIRRVPHFTPPNHRPEMKPDTAGALNTKTIPEASSDSFVAKNENSREIASTCSCGHRSAKEGTLEKRAAKSLLFEVCTANYWKPPLFECCEEEGPSHAKNLFCAGLGSRLLWR